MNSGTTSYNKMSNLESENFKEMFSVFQDLILSMVRNAVRVLPTDKNAKPNIKAHLQVTALSSSVYYDKFLDIKDVFLSCISNVARRSIFEKTIQGFVVDKKQKIRFFIKKSEYQKFDGRSKKIFTSDIKLLEDIINKINDNFNLRLPEAKKQGMLAISKIKSIDIPQKAKYTGKKQEKGRGV